MKLAREIAINHREVEDILKDYSVSTEEWSKLQEDPEFARLLASEVEAWQSAINTHDRTKLKAAALMEMWLEEAQFRLHDPGEALPAKVELAKLIARIAEMGLTNANVTGGGGEKFSVTINLGSDSQIKIAKELPPQVIEHEAAGE